MNEMSLESIWVYPVKSMTGGTVPTAELNELGIAGDRHWAVRSLEISGRSILWEDRAWEDEEQLVAALKNVKAATIVERMDNPLAQSNPLTQGIRAAFADALTGLSYGSYGEFKYPAITRIPKLYSCAAGLGSRDIRGCHFNSIIKNMLAAQPKESTPVLDYEPADSLEGNFLSAYIAGASRDTAAAATFWHSSTVSMTRARPSAASRMSPDEPRIRQLVAASEHSMIHLSHRSWTIFWCRPPSSPAFFTAASNTRTLARQRSGPIPSPST